MLKNKLIPILFGFVFCIGVANTASEPEKWEFVRGKIAAQESRLEKALSSMPVRLAAAGTAGGVTAVLSKQILETGYAVGFLMTIHTYLHKNEAIDFRKELKTNINGYSDPDLWNATDLLRDVHPYFTSKDVITAIATIGATVLTTAGLSMILDYCKKSSAKRLVIDLVENWKDYRDQVPGEIAEIIDAVIVPYNECSDKKAFFKEIAPVLGEKIVRLTEAHQN